jgi:hypothetical protein
MLLNSLGQAYATLLFKLLAQCHQQVLRTKKELNVSDSTASHMLLNSLGQAYATLLFKLLAKRHQQVLRTKKELNVSDSTASRTCCSIVWARLTQHFSSNSSHSAINKFCGYKRN